MNRTASRQLRTTRQWYRCPAVAPRPVAWYRQIPRWVWILTIPALFIFGVGLAVLLVDLRQVTGG